MISETTFSASHIDSISLKYKIDKQLVQKQIAALALLSHLSHNGLQFIFKGGTSLLCLLTPPIRLSLDIDITVAPDTEIMNIVEIISRLGPFKRFEEDRRNSVHQIPKSQFKFSSILSSLETRRNISYWMYSTKRIFIHQLNNR